MEITIDVYKWCMTNWWKSLYLINGRTLPFVVHFMHIAMFSPSKSQCKWVILLKCTLKFACWTLMKLCKEESQTNLHCSIIEARRLWWVKPHFQEHDEWVCNGSHLLSQHLGQDIISLCSCSMFIAKEKCYCFSRKIYSSLMIPHAFLSSADITENLTCMYF